MKAPSTNRLLILNAILLAFILVIMIFLNYDQLIYKFRNYIFYNDDLYNKKTKAVKHYTKQDSIDTDFEGLQNDTLDLSDNIIEIIKAELNRLNWNEAFDTEELYSLNHQTIFCQECPSDLEPGKSLFVATYTNSGNNHCRACSGKISLFEFLKENNNYRLVRKALAFGYGDEYGLEPMNIELVKIGNKNKFALKVPTSYSNQGHDKNSESFYALVNDSLKLVFDFTQYESYNNQLIDVEHTERYMEMRIIESNKEYFDIETKSEGTDWDDKSRGAIDRYIFTGKEYTEK